MNSMMHITHKNDKMLFCALFKILEFLDLSEFARYATGQSKSRVVDV